MAQKACTYFQRHGAQFHLPSLPLSTSLLCLPSLSVHSIGDIQRHPLQTSPAPASVTSGSLLSPWEG